MWYWMKGAQLLSYIPTDIHPKKCFYMQIKNFITMTKSIQIHNRFKFLYNYGTINRVSLNFVTNTIENHDKTSSITHAPLHIYISEHIIFCITIILYLFKLLFAHITINLSTYLSHIIYTTNIYITNKKTDDRKTTCNDSRFFLFF